MFQFENASLQDFSIKLKKIMTTNYPFSDDTVNKNLLEHFLRGLKNENIQRKSITQVEDNFEKAVQNVEALQNAEIYISALKHRSMNVNKVACTKNSRPKKFKNSSQKQKIYNHTNFANSNVNMENFKSYICANASHLSYRCNYINIICNLCKNRGHLSKVC